jgi:glycosyltransferase involved in cell wall biosynthesis
MLITGLLPKRLKAGIRKLPKTGGKTRKKIAAFLARCRESLAYSLVSQRNDTVFFIVSSERNAGKSAVNCLDSVFSQRYPKDMVTHIFIDDASTDNTDKLVRAWLKEHPDNSVKYIANKEHKGGTSNNLTGFRLAPPGSIVLELNGDDWLPDGNVLKFLSKVYADKNIWMTYNTFVYEIGGRRYPCPTFGPIPKEVVEKNAVRDHRWTSSALHTFRAELFFKLREESFIDPDTGEYWLSADDQAMYLAMLEMAGKHSRHIYRTTYVYNLNERSDQMQNPEGQLEREKRIRKMKKYEPLDRLV